MYRKDSCRICFDLKFFIFFFLNKPNCEARFFCWAFTDQCSSRTDCLNDHSTGNDGYTKLMHICMLCDGTILTLSFISLS